MRPGPEARYEQTEAISLAFVTALQILPPRQVAVLILRDVLGFHASEVAGMLEVTVESANSTLKRARASLQRRQQPPSAANRRPPPGSPAEDAIVAKFARAWESADLDALVALLTDDVFIAMPPIPFGYEGRDAVTRYCASLFAAGRGFDLVPVRANGQPAFGAYLRGPAGVRHATAFYVLTLSGGQICGMTRFDDGALPVHRPLPDRSPADSQHQPGPGRHPGVHHRVPARPRHRRDPRSAPARAPACSPCSPPPAQPPQ